MDDEIGLILPLHGAVFAEALAGARAADEAGLAAVWVPDTLMNSGRPRAGVLACEPVLAAAAAVVRRARLGTLVLSTPFRHPPLLAKQLATLESLVPGRLRVGLGAGGMTYRETCRELGYPLLPPLDRVAHVEETVACLRALWSDEPADFEGRFCEAHRVRMHPRPERPIPIVLAARRRRMLALTARVADGWNCPLPHELAQGLEALETLGRPRDTLEVSVYAIGVLGESEADAKRALQRAGPAAQLFGDVESHHVFGGPERAAECIARLHRQGATHVALDPRGRPLGEWLDLLVREVLPRLGAPG